MAVGALAAGMGGALWRAGTGEPAGVGALWNERFDEPAGGELVMSVLRGRPLLLNFWATWCPPCVTELPMLDRFQRDHAQAGWRVVGLAIDGPTPVREFLTRQPLGFPVGLAGLNGVELSRSLGNESGGLPFTVVFDRRGSLVARKLGALKGDDLQAWVAAVH
jgi:thiol-disulfide isomerase/thioredoxin